MKLGAHGPNRRKSRPRAQIMRKSIFDGRIAIFMKFLRPLTAQIGARAVPELKLR